MATPGTAASGNGAHGLQHALDEADAVKQLLVDVKVASLLAGHARRRVVTQVFGIPEEDQTFLVTIIVLGAGASVVGGAVSRFVPHPTRGDFAMGGAVVDTGLRAMVGAPTSAVPAAGALLAFALLAHSARPAVAASLRGARGVAHGSRWLVDTVFGMPPGVKPAAARSAPA